MTDSSSGFEMYKVRLGYLTLLESKEATLGLCPKDIGATWPKMDHLHITMQSTETHHIIKIH